MGLFDSKDDTKQRHAKSLEDRIEALTVEIAKLTAQKDARQEAEALREERDRLAQQVTDQRIELDRVAEEKARADREIEHKLGLHRTQIEAERERMSKDAESERERAVQEAKIAVREENMADREAMYEKQAENMRESMERELDAMRNLMSQAMDRLPKFEHLRRETVGSPALPAGDGDDAE